MATREPYSWSSRQGALLGHDGLTGSVPLPAVGPLVLFEKLFCPLASTAAEILVPEQRELRGPIGLVASAAVHFSLSSTLSSRSSAKLQMERKLLSRSAAALFTAEARCSCWYRHTPLFRALGCVLGKGAMQGQGVQLARF